LRSDAELSGIVGAEVVDCWAEIDVFSGKLVEKPGVAAGEDSKEE
jgi:hypothetical protein